MIGLVDNTGTLVVEYKYDAWSKPLGKVGTLASTLGTLNPFRYRGYVYDEETGLYYLQSRYYNPAWGRFINADVLLGQVGALLGHNVFAYCRNNSILRKDDSGFVDVIYCSRNNYVIENDNFAHNFLFGTNFYVEVEGTRYPANSAETVTLDDWNNVNFLFIDQGFDQMVEAAGIYSSLISVFDESLKGGLDFKLQLENELYYLNGTIYNKNEAGNFIWAYYLAENGYPDLFQGILAQGGSLFPDINKIGRMNILDAILSNDMRLDEPHNRRARYAGLKYWYQRNGKEWIYYLKHGFSQD